MTDTQNNAQKTQDQNQTNPQQAKTVPMHVHAQYIKDLSLENPHAPTSLLPGQAQPEMDVGINVDCRRMPDDVFQPGSREPEEDRQDPKAWVYEVVLSIEAKAKRQEQVLFMAEIHYGILVSIPRQVQENMHHAMLLIEGPRLIFPFARQILADATQHAGYPPLLLNPVDFEGMYKQRFAAEMERNEQATKTGTAR